MSQIPFKSGEKVVCYARYSPGEEQKNKDRSVEEQINDIKKFCTENDLILDRSFSDAGVSGTSMKGRDGFFDMMAFLKQRPKPPVAGVIVWIFSRFSRNMETAQYYKADLRHLGYKVWSLQPDEQFEDNATGKLMETIVDWKNQMYSEEISAQVSRALRQNFEYFNVLPGVPPLGFIRIPVQMPAKKDGSERVGYRFEPDPAMIPIFRHAFEMKASGAVSKDILRAMGGIYKKSVSLCDMFGRTIYYGSVTYCGVTKEEYCQPMVSRELWEKANEVQMEGKRQYSRRGSYANDTGILSGMLLCGNCGAKMRLNRRVTKGREYKSYRCHECKESKQIRCEAIDKSVMDCVLNKILSDENIEFMIVTAMDDFQKLERSSSERKTDYSVQLDAIEKKIQNVTNAIADMGLNEILRTKLFELQEQKRIIVENRSTEQREVTDAKTWIDAAYAACIEIKKALENEDLSNGEKREFLKLLIHDITQIDENHASLHYSLPVDNKNVVSLDLCPQRDAAIWHNLFEILVNILKIPYAEYVHDD